MQNRREFLKRASLMLAGGMVMPQLLSSCAGKVSASYNPQNQKSRFQKRKIKKNGKRFVDSLYSLIDLKTI